MHTYVIQILNLQEEKNFKRALLILRVAQAQLSVAQRNQETVITRLVQLLWALLVLQG